MKLMLLIVPALLIDALQAGVSMALAGVSAGAALIPIAGAAAPVGIVVGFVISVTLSLTFGWLVILLLGWQGMLYPGIAAMAFIGESVPGFGLLPVWTGLVFASYIRHVGKTSAEGTAAAATAASLAARPAVQAIRIAQIGNETNAKTA